MHMPMHMPMHNAHIFSHDATDLLWHLATLVPWLLIYLSTSLLSLLSHLFTSALPIMPSGRTVVLRLDQLRAQNIQVGRAWPNTTAEHGRTWPNTAEHGRTSNNHTKVTLDFLPYLLALLVTYLLIDHAITQR